MARHLPLKEQFPAEDAWIFGLARTDYMVAPKEALTPNHSHNQKQNLRKTPALNRYISCYKS